MVHTKGHPIFARKISYINMETPQLMRGRFQGTMNQGGMNPLEELHPT